MDIENWLTYVLAYFVISVIPGPSVLMVIGQSLSRGFVLGAYSVFAYRLRKTMQGINARKRMGYLGGSLLLGGSALMASTR